jgi:uncharacterized protein (TIGR03067 family)
MKHMSRLAGVILLGCCCALGKATAADAEAGFKPLFNGQDLTGWEGLPQFWSVKEGVITGQTTKENPVKRNTFLVWKGGDVSDFELRLSYKITPNAERGSANSGIQYRSKLADPGYFVVHGYQADFESGKSFSGILYEEGGRGILAQRGQKVVIRPDSADGNKPKITVVGTLGDSEEIQRRIKAGGWNEYVVIAKGNHLQHFINGVPTVDVTDEQPNKAAKSGILALQLHQGDPMTVQFKDVRIKPLSGQASGKSDVEQVQGNWGVKELVYHGETLPAEALKAIKLKITGKEFVLETNEDTYRGKLGLKPDTSPKQMNATLDDGTEVLAIYEVSGDTMKVCYADPDSDRPTSFKSAPGSDWVLTVYKRQ